MRPANGTTSAALIVLLLIVAIAAFAYVSFSNQQKKQAPAQLTLAIPIVQAAGGRETTFSFGITNAGGDAHQVTLKIQSSSFGEVDLPAADVAAGSQVVDPATIQLRDLVNGQYPVSTVLAYSDVNGTHQMTGSFSFYLLPNVQVTSFSWQPGGILNLQQKDIIGPNDNTKFSMKVESGSGSATYVHLSVSASFAEVAEGLTITPSTQTVSDVGPSGTTQAYSFTVTSNNTPSGKYNIIISVLADGIVAAQQTVVLTVTS